MTAPNSADPTPMSELRKLPRTDRLVEAADRAGLLARLGRGPVLEAVRDELDRIRKQVLGGANCPPPGEIEAALLARLAEAARGSLRPVVNATGVVVHTNLGRAPLSEDALAAMRAAAQGYTNLEYDLAAGERGDRYGHAEGALARLTGAEGAVAVNNNAAAVMLALAALVETRPSASAQGGPPGGREAADAGGERPEVIVSRGQLVEIGGGFRIPDVLRRSGAALVEVGTTNRTYLKDFEEAIGPRTRLLLSVHRSNFKVAGFIHDATLEELVGLGRARDLWMVDDLGSGLAPRDRAVRPRGRADRPGARRGGGRISVCFSGDKLLGGPQAGILAGRREAIRRVKRHPLMRALRLDKVTLAALSATLAHYERGDATARIPVWRAIALEPAALRERAAAVAGRPGRGGARAARSASRGPRSAAARCRR